ncbi:fungal hydrophobin [Trametes versicolor FP-101664 SS1]|uniref:fungal hydrophobin n=1 Tax=Trametes versicolor (strain FP-101664) TaxID=717944 RepID=UPI00046229FA|nr:fungal hydrophobin [Trametes versicolor FP-101664 SS1]EIW52223.1 fungal hydrophobin [Trametes versicolor FP-101664 SS1]
MFAKLTSTVVSFAILAVATAAPNNTPTAPAAPAPSAPAGGAGAGSCSTGALQCCQSVESGSSAAVAPILAALGVVLQDVNIPVGLSCSDITGVGVGGGNSCSANTVCCDDNSFGGLLSVGCLPASL